MSQKVREEMLPRLRQRYVVRGREGRSRMIDELCEQFGYSRKHAIKLLNARAGWGGDPAVRKGRPVVYEPQVVEVLWRIWRAAEQPCGKRLVELLSLWLPHYEREHGKLARATRQKVLAVSPAQADRLLASRKASSQRRGRCGTKPGSLLKTHIPIRTDNWDITVPGYLEADTVAHCGTSLGRRLHLERHLHRHLQRLDLAARGMEQGRGGHRGRHARGRSRTALRPAGL